MGSLVAMNKSGVNLNTVLNASGPRPRVLFGPFTPGTQRKQRRISRPRDPTCRGHAEPTR